MTIKEAKKRCDELREQLSIIRDKYDFDNFANAIGREKSIPLEKELDKLVYAIIKAENETEI